MFQVKFVLVYALYGVCIQTSVWIVYDQKKSRPDEACKVCHVVLARHDMTHRLTFNIIPIYTYIFFSNGSTAPWGA
jgi:hypothetical protein